MPKRILVALIGAAITAASGPAAHAYVYFQFPDSGEGYGANFAEDARFTIQVDFGVDGEGARELVLKVRPQSGGTCAGTAAADAGQQLLAEVVTGDGSRRVTRVEPESGDFLACAWLANPASTGTGSEGPASGPYLVRAPVTSIELGLVPPVALRGMPVGIAGSAEGAPGRWVFAGFGAMSRQSACPHSAAGSAFDAFFPGGREFRTGAMEFVHFVRPPGPGRYLACGWVEEPGDPRAEAAASLPVTIPAARTKTTTAIASLVESSQTRADLWVDVAARRADLPIERGRIVIERTRDYRRFRRIGRPIDLAKAIRYDICVRGQPMRELVHMLVRHRPGVSLRARYLPAADFAGSTSFAGPSPDGLHDVHGYDVNRDRCVKRPVRAPVR